MADTIRTRSAVLTIFADNATKAISAQDLRDFVVSVWGVFGELYVTDATTVTTISTSPAPLTAWTVEGEYDGLTLDLSTGKITVPTNKEGTFRVDCDISFKGDHNLKTKFELYRTAADIGRTASARTFMNRDLDGVVSASFHGYVTAAAGDEFQIYVSGNTSGNIVVIDGQFSMYRVK